MKNKNISTVRGMHDIYGNSFWQKSLFKSLNLKLHETENNVSLKINKLIKSQNLDSIVNKITYTIEDLN